MIVAYKMPEQQQEIYEIIEHLRFFSTLFICAEFYIIPSKTTRFMDVFECRIRLMGKTSE